MCCIQKSAVSPFILRHMISFLILNRQIQSDFVFLLHIFRLIMNINKDGREWSELHRMIGTQAYVQSLHGLHIQLKQNYLNRYI
jgi:hypothetical protein